ncbi:MAG: hypothetical protein ABIN99_06520 [Nitrosospira sp.]
MRSVFAAFEHDILHDRLRAGVAAARKAGKAHGRPVTIQKYLPEIRRLHAAVTSKREIAKRLKIARISVRRLLKASRTRRRPVPARPRKAA